jgi:hypothetical protein
MGGDLSALEEEEEESEEEELPDTGWVKVQVKKQRVPEADDLDNDHYKDVALGAEVFFPPLLL